MHVDVHNYFLRKLKDQGLLVIKYIPGNENNVNIFKKNVTSAIFNCHIPLYVGCNKYLEQTQALSREAVSG